MLSAAVVAKGQVLRVEVEPSVEAAMAAADRVERVMAATTAAGMATVVATSAAVKVMVAAKMSCTSYA